MPDTATAKLEVEVTYDPEVTDPEGLATALDRLLGHALSTPGIFEDYGNPEVGEFVPVAKEPDTGHHAGRTCEISLGADRIRIEVDPRGNGTITSNLKDDSGEDAAAYDAAIDGLESLLLALACQGVDVTTPDFREAVQTALGAIANNLG
jgi:hypothetical protein